jgi:hypothetical protein
VAKGQNSRVVAERVETASEPLFGYEFRSGWGFRAFVTFAGINVVGLIIWKEDHRRQLADDSSMAMRPG